MPGNRCRHDPRRPRRSLVRGGSHRRPPLVLSEMAKAFARAIWERPEAFPELAATRDRDIARRSERLEAIGLVVMALAVRAELLSLRVLWKGEGLSERLLSRWTRLSERRVRRALFDLRWAGFVRGPGKMGPNRIPQPVEEYNPGPHCRRPACVACRRGLPHLRGKIAIRQLTPALWAKLGMDGWLSDQQKRRYAELHPPPPERRPMSEAAAALQRQSVAREVRMLAEARGRPPD